MYVHDLNAPVRNISRAAAGMSLVEVVRTPCCPPNVGGFFINIGDTPITPSGEYLLYLSFTANLSLREMAGVRFGY